MADIIHLLPDAVANQIAAGEVIQRPASAVKELLENAIDAKAVHITLMIKDAGKALIKVVDDGVGMSETDARLSFERHATSKIKKSDDLFSIKTKGFRGEALASIAAIAQVELKTKLNNQELGTQIIIEGSEVKEQEVCSCPQGTTFSIKNLFFNVPARRNFLKSNAVEVKHIIDEFERVALVHTDISFYMYNNDNEVFNLPKATFRQRIVSVFGDKYNQKLVPVSETTDIVGIEGFVGKPAFAKKTRGEQYFFVNDRFIKSAYLNHAVQNAFQQLLAKDLFPSYFLKLTIDTSKIDINIHPTKTEIKFEDERSIYAILRTAIKQSLGKFNIAPTLDFDQEASFKIPLFKNTDAIKTPTIKINPNYNPFVSKPSERIEHKQNTQQWNSLYNSFEKDSLAIIQHQENTQKQQLITPQWENETLDDEHIFLQLHAQYILAQFNNNYFIIDQQRAHERILYEQFMVNFDKKNGNSQQLLFPETIEFTNADTELINEITPEIKILGFDFNQMGKNTFVISGIPSEINNPKTKTIFEHLLEQFKINKSELKLEKRENLAISMARNASIKKGEKLAAEEMENLVKQLFACEMPYTLPNGKPTIISLNLNDLNQQFDY